MSITITGSKRKQDLNVPNIITAKELTLSGDLNTSGNIQLNHTKEIRAKKSGGSTHKILNINSSDNVVLGSTDINVEIQSTSTPQFTNGSNTYHLLHTGIMGAGSNLDADKVDGIHGTDLMKKVADSDLLFNIVKNGDSQGIVWSGISDKHAIFVEETDNVESTNLIVYSDDNSGDGVIFRHKLSSGTSKDVVSIQRDLVSIYSEINANDGINVTSGDLNLANGKLNSMELTTGNNQMVNSSSDTIFVGNPNTKLRLESSSNLKAYIKDLGEFTIWHSGNDGSSSGLDADKIDGKHFSDIQGDAQLKADQAEQNSKDYADNLINLNVMRWTKTVSINSVTPAEILDYDNTSLDFNYSYLVTARVKHTGTDAASIAYFKANGSDNNATTFLLNKIYESGTISNHIEIYIDGVTNKPMVRLYNHNSMYDVELQIEKQRANVFESQALANSAEQNAKSASVSKSGDTMTGSLTTVAEQYFSSNKFGIDMKNSDIIGVNALVLGDEANGATEGLLFPKTGISRSSSVDDYYSFRIDGSGNALINDKKVWNEANDGSGSGLDADLIDGIQGSQLVRNDINNTLNGMLTVNAPTMDHGVVINTKYDQGDRVASLLFVGDSDVGEGNQPDDIAIEIRGNGSGGSATDTNTTFLMYMNGSMVIGKEINTSPTSYTLANGSMLDITGSVTTTDGYFVGSNQVWHAGNDGVGSGLDADKLGGISSSNYVRNDSANQKVNGSFTVAGLGILYVGDNNDDGQVVVRGNSGTETIQLDGNGNNKIVESTIYMNGDVGSAEFSGNVSVDALTIRSSAKVANLNASFINGVAEEDLAKTKSLYDLSGYGIHSGLFVSAQSVPNMTVLVEDGIVFTDSGKRFVVNTQSVSISSASATYDRYDVIYVQGSSSGNNEGQLSVKTGTPASTPVEPSLPSDGVKIAVIHVKKNIGSITDGTSGTYDAISDVRKWKPFMYDHDDESTYIETARVNSIRAHNEVVIDLEQPIRGSFATSLTIPADQTSVQWTHNLGLSQYTVMLSCNSVEPHLYWDNKQSNSIDIYMDDVCDEEVTIDAVIIAY
ncbi:hypothetical protein [Chengkuizengella axinellae]|uniref:Carbohydrate-binding domain-containing protein n=1 Tax=Chengkuizengella axinellae TaxID=3064388 RepID=A0ABT9IWG7_9BACL|nr:hypothetical protein [Chengkuizengella sp. 2205SS18-9]MDP5273680.1 hypothetical protein [Chengkuizengella sp. 2205SS18-9]